MLPLVFTKSSRSSSCLALVWWQLSAPSWTSGPGRTTRLELYRNCTTSVNQLSQDSGLNPIDSDVVISRWRLRLSNDHGVLNQLRRPRLRLWCHRFEFESRVCRRVLASRFLRLRRPSPCRHSECCAYLWNFLSRVTTNFRLVQSQTLLLLPFGRSQKRLISFGNWFVK